MDFHLLRSPRITIAIVLLFFLFGVSVHGHNHDAPDLLQLELGKQKERRDNFDPMEKEVTNYKRNSYSDETFEDNEEEDSSLDEIDCNSYSGNCTECLLHESVFGDKLCQYCAENSKCYNSTSQDAGCSLWLTHNCEGPDSCEDILECNMCITFSKCGWCDGRVCLPGNATGPENGEVCQIQWVYNPNGTNSGAQHQPDLSPGFASTCSALPNCSNLLDCFACTEYGICGWCSDNSGHCMFASEFNQSSCSHFSWGNQSCHGSVDCEVHSSCSSCIEDISGECGWCQSTHQCVLVSEDINCDDWKENTCEDSCFAFSANCSACISNDACGFCNETYCVAGNSTSALFVKCATWGFNYCPVDCSTLTECASCLLFSTCGWCQASYSCLQSMQSSQCGGTFYVQSCPADVYSCGDFDSCDTCQLNSNCKWCDNFCQSTTEASCSGDCGGNGGLLTSGWIAVIVLGAIILIASAFAGVVFYRFYWLKRHYYETLR